MALRLSIRTSSPLFSQAGTRLRDGLASVQAPRVLASLVLNPIALYALYDTIQEQQPEAWGDALERDGRELMEQHGIRMPSFEELTGKTRKTTGRALVGALTVTGPAPQFAAPERTWRVERTVEECHWNRGDPASVAGGKATVQLEWYAAGVL